jgi:SAM-dependent methyltransferase
MDEIALGIWEGRNNAGTYFSEYEANRISQYLATRVRGTNLDIGGGANSGVYVPGSVVLDRSLKCLKANPEKEKVVFDLDAVGSPFGRFWPGLPFKDQCFDSATMISVWQYLSQPTRLVSEIARVVKGELILVHQEGRGIHELMKSSSTTFGIMAEMDFTGWKYKRERIFLQKDRPSDPDFYAIRLDLESVRN